MRKIRNALLSILTVMFGAILAVPRGGRTIYSWRLQRGARAFFQLSLWGLLSQEGEARIRQSLRQPLLRELLRLSILLRLPELPFSLLLVIRRHGSSS